MQAIFLSFAKKYLFKNWSWFLMVGMAGVIYFQSQSVANLREQQTELKVKLKQQEEVKGLLIRNIKQSNDATIAEEEKLRASQRDAVKLRQTIKQLKQESNIVITEILNAPIPNTCEASMHLLREYIDAVGFQ